MIEANEFVQAAAGRGFGLYSGVPCSFLKPFINYVSASDSLRYIPAANEGDAVAIAAGAELAGTHAVAMMQNSGLGNAVNPLTSLTHTFRIPVLLIITLRGDPEGAPDEPQHGLMGPITTRMLELMAIPWRWFPNTDEAIGPALDAAQEHMAREGRPFALVMRKGDVAAFPHPAALPAEPITAPALRSAPPAPSTTRGAMLDALRGTLTKDDVVIATTGFTGRELYALGDDARQLYMVGSMGCAVSLALGIAITKPERRVIAVDGDGALLMRMGALATVGYQRPSNLLHLVLDNSCHESTGGQPTVSVSLDIPAIAAACGYPRVERISEPSQLAKRLSEGQAGLALIHLPVAPGIMDELPRPTITPEQVAVRLRENLRSAP